MRVLSIAVAACLALAACHASSGSENSGPQPASGNTTEARPSGANGTPSGQGAT